jgi:hypothetical protein
VQLAHVLVKPFHREPLSHHEIAQGLRFDPPCAAIRGDALDGEPSQFARIEPPVHEPARDAANIRRLRRREMLGVERSDLDFWHKGIL